MDLLEALSNGKFNIARDIILESIAKESSGKNSWDSKQYTTDRKIQETIKLDKTRDLLFTYSGLDTLKKRYFLRDSNGKIVEDLQNFFARVATGVARGDAALAQRLYDGMSQQYFMLATPVLTNAGTNRGMQISCFLNRAADSVESVCGSIIAENAQISKGGGGIGTYYGDVRGKGAKISWGGIAGGTIPFIKMIDSLVPAINQGGTRKGAAAVYQRVDHPDIEEFLNIRKPTGGDENRRCMNLNHGVCLTDEFMRAVESGSDYDLICPNSKKSVGKLNAREIWTHILKIRFETGEPYILFVDTINRTAPEWHKAMGLEVVQSNLCSEITLPTTYDRTAVCCLGSMNLETWDQWKDQAEAVVGDAVTALDNVLSNFIETASDSYERAKYSAMCERSIGLGVMGYHGYLMQRNWPFESITARSFNKVSFRTIKQAALKKSEQLGVERGICPDGGNRRNSYLIAIAPTATISTICGGATPCIEPINANSFPIETMNGTYIIRNKYLEALLESKQMNTHEVWRTITDNDGSVQHLDFLTEAEKRVFKTNSEINQKELVIQAAHRQKEIDEGGGGQAQSLNLFFQTPVDIQKVHEVHFMAWKIGVKSLYYVRGKSAAKADTAGTLTASVAKAPAPTECLMCQ